MEGSVKFLCPSCHGKVAIEQDYYREVVGKPIECPHCQKKMIVPGNTERLSHQKAPFEDLRTTQKLNLVPVAPAPPPARPPDGDSVRCPHCGAEVGKRDRVCIRCENKLTPQA